MQILKIYGVLKYIANISGLTAFARHSLGSCFFEGCDLYLLPNLFNLQQRAFLINIFIQMTLVCLWLPYSCHRVSHLSEPAAHAI